MAISKYTLYKYVKVAGTWRYCKAAYHDNGKIKPDIVLVNVKQALLEKHPEGRYHMNHSGGWIDAGTDALEAQRKRKQRLALDEFNRTSGKGAAPGSVLLPDSPGKVTLAAAAEKYFANCEARGLDSETIRKYRAAVDPFVEHCGVTHVDECRENKQVLIDYMGCLRKQPIPKRTHSNPERTLANKVGDVRIFLKEFGITKLLKKNEEPKYHEKKIVAHPDDELDVLYAATDAEESFLLDFFIGSMARDHEAYGKYGDPDLTGTILTLYGKRHKTRTVEITRRLADSIGKRRKRLGTAPNGPLFLNRKGKPDKHLLRKLQDLAKKAGAKFHTELHKLRKTGASRRYLAGVPLVLSQMRWTDESHRTIHGCRTPTPFSSKGLCRRMNHTLQPDNCACCGALTTSLSACQTNPCLPPLHPPPRRYCLVLATSVGILCRELRFVAQLGHISKPPLPSIEFA